MTRLLTAVFAAALACLVTLTGGLAAFMTSFGADCTASSAATDTGDSSGAARLTAVAGGLGRRASRQRGHDRHRRRPVSRPAARAGHRPRDRRPGVRAAQPALRRPGLPRPVPATPLPGVGHSHPDPRPRLRRHPLLPGTPRRARLADPAAHGRRTRRPTQRPPRRLRRTRDGRHPAVRRDHRHRRPRVYDSGACVPAADELTSPSLPAGLALPPSLPPRVAAAISWALAQLGTPYSYGGDCTAAHSGNPVHQCDCSSLVQQAYAHAGISLPRAAADQSRFGTPIPMDRIQPGDLIFESGADGTPTNPGHVALALGNGYLVEAPHTGAVVRIAPTFLPDVVAVRRVVPDGPTAEPAQPLPTLRRPG